MKIPGILQQYYQVTDQRQMPSLVATTEYQHALDTVVNEQCIIGYKGAATETQTKQSRLTLDKTLWCYRIATGQWSSV